MPTGITDLGQAILVSLSAIVYSILAAVPHIIGFIIILLIGWFVADLIAKVVAAALRTIRFNDMAQRAGISGFLQKMGAKTDPSGTMAAVVRWFIRLIALVVAFDALGLPAVSGILQAFLLFIPNLIVAVVILVITGLIANALADLVRGATAQAGLGSPALLSSIVRIAVWGFGIIIAVNQIGVASTLVNTLFMGLVAALALALGLAFGLGGRDTAAQIVQGWYEAGKEAGPKLAEAAEAASRQTQAAASAVPARDVPTSNVVISPPSHPAR
ncbi:MAG: mechanosensitive ion channel family protein [Chloroflexia bacterium]